MSTDIETSYLEDLNSRGILAAERRIYLRILGELREFLEPLSPKEWSRQDLERFLKSRAPTLAFEELQAYGLAMGVLSERIEKAVAIRPSSPGKFGEVGDVSLKTSSTMNFESMAFGDTLHPARFNPTLHDEITTEDDDFLAENIANWKDRRDTGDSEFPRIPTQPRFGRVKSSPRLDSGLEIQWNTELRLMELEWRGFVMGEGLRAALHQGTEAQERYASSRWLGDFSDAGVISQDDTDWFIDWLQSIAALGVARFAIVSPTHPIAKMKLYRLRDISDASQLSILGVQKLDLRFFDTRVQATYWLCQ